MTAGGGDFERALGDLLPFHLHEVGPAFRRLRLGRRGRGKQCRPFQVSQEGQKVGGSDHVELAGPARLAGLRRRADQPLVEAGSVDRGEEDSG